MRSHTRFKLPSAKPTRNLQTATSQLPATNQLLRQIGYRKLSATVENQQTATRIGANVRQEAERTTKD